MLFLNEAGILQGEAVAKCLAELVPMKQSGIGEDTLCFEVCKFLGYYVWRVRKDIPRLEYSRAGPSGMQPGMH